VFHPWNLRMDKRAQNKFNMRGYSQ
jgi:hypothetical protein